MDPDSAAIPPAAACERPRLVIDTNVWLDLLAFHDPGVARLRDTLPHFDCIASPTMRAELQAVLGRRRFALDPDGQAEALGHFDALVRLVAESPDCRLGCSDPDDRVFLDTAVGQRATWLLSRDKALLKARRHALRRHALLIGRPEDFYRWLDAGPAGGQATVHASAQAATQPA